MPWLWHAVPAYPTLSEVWLRLLETYGRSAGVDEQRRTDVAPAA